MEYVAGWGINPEPAEPEVMTLELARAYIAMEIEEVSLIQSQVSIWESGYMGLEGKKEGLQLALGILNQTA